MLRAEILAIRRKVREHKAGFEVKDDPWELVEELLQENERLRRIVQNPDPAAWVVP